MTAETRSRIFDPFFTTKFTGRGLGLAAVLGIVRGHRGAIKFYSEVGKGTSIKILLPAVEWKPGERMKISEKSASLQDGGTILLVDDDPYVLESISTLLRAFGFTVKTCDNASSAVQEIQRTPIDVVLTDIKMPGLTGVKLLGMIHKFDSQIPVIQTF